ncbi:glycosyltransferase family 1 protein [Sanguibacter sp. 25GB23B1]|uniref:glycosyltransferase family 4 protein n=1 Tax=unclassified Sanguibacter TaxID=2645534 RepID=UPI0032AF77F9
MSLPHGAHPSDNAAALSVAMVVEQCWRPAPGGSGRYIVELATELARSEDVTLRGVAARHPTPPPLGLRPPLPIDHSRLPSHLLVRAWDRLGRPRVEDIVSGPTDVVHATTWALPATERPLVVTIHDLAFLRFPEHFTPRGRSYFTRAVARAKERADVILVPSEATAADCYENGFDPDRVRVVPLGLTTIPTTAHDVAAFRARHGLPDRFVLWCGTLEPRKNLDGLLAAFAQVADGDGDLDLVLVGPPGWGAEAAPVAERLRPRVHTLGFLDDADLHLAYAAAAAFVFPSHWEGFGLPVLEAMGHGIPVVTSANSSMAEVAGSAGVLVDPSDPAAIADGIRTAVGADRSRLAAQSLDRARDFTWRRTAEATRAAYEEALASPGR